MSFRSATVTFVLLVFTTLLFAKPATLVRDEIPDEFKWNLADIYADWDAWTAGMQKMNELGQKVAGFKGTLNEGPEHLATVLKAQDDLYRVMDRVVNYPALMAVEDLGRNDVQAKLQEANLATNRIGQQTAWFTPELLTIPRTTMEEWIASTPELKEYSFNLMENYRLQEHVLDEEGEKLLSIAGPFTGVPADAYQMLSTADAQFPMVTLSTGEEVQVTYGNYQNVLRTSWVQEDRRAMTVGYYSVYDEYANSFASLYNGIVQRDWFYAQARNYGSSVERSLSGNNIPVDVYTTLVNTAKDGSAPLQRYHELRQQVLGLETYHYFDAYLPLVEVEEEFSWDTAKEMLLASAKPMGDEYVETVQRAFDERWIDVYENEGKESGAFNQGIFDVHPYVKMNYSDTMEDVFTLAHELGHSMHSVMSSKYQPYATHGYATFIAEVASTMGEAFLMDEMLKQTKDPKVRVALLQQRIDGIAGTFYRQAMFADYELAAHRLAEEGKPVTADVLKETYMNSMRAIFGESLDEQEMYENTWAYVPHFFVMPPFYVFQYATSLAASTKLHNDLVTGSKKEKKAARERYITLISSGGSDHPVTLLANAGVDMTDAATYQAIVDEMDQRVSQLEVELKKMGKLEK